MLGEVRSVLDGMSIHAGRRRSLACDGPVLRCVFWHFRDFPAVTGRAELLRVSQAFFFPDVDCLPKTADRIAHVLIVSHLWAPFPTLPAPDILDGAGNVGKVEFTFRG
jgi:hypothetical protein